MVGAGFMIIGFLLIGMASGWAAWLIYGRRQDMSWLELFFVGILGSFVGGTLLSWLMGYGLELQMTGFIGSIIGALIVLPIYAWLRRSVKGDDA
jgi:uncharacterized membrane protein YeaQ/YmgE (transglycosylase-associated protein family)